MLVIIFLHPGLGECKGGLKFFLSFLNVLDVAIGVCGWVGDWILDKEWGMGSIVCEERGDSGR